jgi:tetratricopeptide (TPR) repeat protein
LRRIFYQAAAGLFNSSKMKQIFSLVFSLFFLTAAAQQDTTIQRLQKELAAATSVSGKLDVVFQLAQQYNLENPQACQEILEKGIFIAEESRNREMMAKAARIAGNIYSQMSGLKEYSEKANTYLQQALAICKKERGMENEKISCNMTMARFLRNSGKNQEAKKCNEEAMSVATETGNDSLVVITKLGYGRTQLAAGEKLDAFKTCLYAQELAEKSKHPNKDWLQILAYNSLAGFYESIEDYDRAIDYQYKSLEYAKKNNNTADIFSTLYGIGNTYNAAKKYDAAKNIYQQVIYLGDSLNKPDNKIQGQIGFVNTLMNGPDNKKSLDYLNAHPEIKALFERLHLGYQLDYGMAQVYVILKKYDSARYYYNKSLPVLEKLSSVAALPGVYLTYSKFLYESGEHNKAITYLLKAKAINDSTDNNDSNTDYYEMLDSCYQKTGDYKQAFYYKSLFAKAKASLEEKSKQKDVLAVEIDAETRRKERLEKEDEEATRQRHNWQYMGIILGIVSLFIGLASLGLFRVSPKWIRVLGFISFIFLFEFIILLADKWIHHLTHGEPLYILAIKVVLIAILLPLHHFLEHKLIHYITQRHHKKPAAA